MRQLPGAAQQVLQETQRLAQGRQAVVRFGQRMRQTTFQQADPATAVKERPESGRPGMRAEFLVGKLDLDGLAAAFELNGRCHRLVRRVRARTLIGFVHKNNQYTNGGTIPTAWLRLSRKTLLLPPLF